MSKKYCSTKDDVPRVKHYAIVVFSSYTVPGDERSRTNPGHGYPEHSENKAEYIAFTDREEWEREVESMTGKVWREKNFVALVVTPTSVQTKVTIKVEVLEG